MFWPSLAGEHSFPIAGLHKIRIVAMLLVGFRPVILDLTVSAAQGSPSWAKFCRQDRLLRICRTMPANTIAASTGHTQGLSSLSFGG